jgi:hypothetical protein
MIDRAFKFLEAEVNAYFDARFGPDTEKWVALGNIAKAAENNDGGGGGVGNDNNARAILGLVNIEEDRISKNPENVVRTPGGVFYQNPKIHLNLYALFAVTISNYPVALQTLSIIIQCFQRNRVFDSSTHPSLDPGIERLTLDLFTINFEQVNHLWSTLGGKYLPSVMYKIRVIGLEDTSNRVEGSLIREIQIQDGIMSR